jgi:hypothetical protein
VSRHRGWRQFFACVSFPCDQRSACYFHDRIGELTETDQAAKVEEPKLCGVSMEFTFKASPYLSKSGSWSDPKARRQFAHNIRTESQCGDTFIFGESVAGTDCDPTISFIRPNLPEGNGDFQTNEVERLTGYRPQTFQVWSREHRSNFL